MPEKSTIVRFIRTGARATRMVAPGLAARWLERLFLTPSRRPMASREAGWMAIARRSSVRFDDARRMPVYSWGTPGSGPTVLLAHGWSSRASQLGTFVGPLLERGYRVVAFDAPGHGEADGQRSALPELALAIERVAERVGPIHAVIAHSLGTAATTIAISRGLSVDRLVYIAPPENPGEYLYRTARFLGFGDGVARLAQDRIEGHYDFPFARARATTLAAAIDIPLLVIHDRNDRQVPYQEGEDLVAGWPGAELISTNGLGHNRILRDAEVREAAVGFVAATGPRPLAVAS